jgi:hypothetical protein
MTTLARRANISTNHYQDIAHANANPSTGVLLKLASAHGVTMRESFDPQLQDSDGRIVSEEDLARRLAAHKQLTMGIERLTDDDIGNPKAPA